MSISDSPNREVKKTIGQLIAHIVRRALCLGILFILFGNIFVFAQEKEKNQEKGKKGLVEKLNFHLNLKNMHTWHGLIVTHDIMAASSIEYVSDNKKFILGLWGGSGASGVYKEFSYYTTYKFFPNFSASVISHNNWGEWEALGGQNVANILSYDKETSPDFVDIVLEYKISKETPLTIYWSTILGGNRQDFVKASDGSITDSYSNYVELKYDIFDNDAGKLNIFLGGAFSFVTEKTFYSKSSNITTVGLLLGREVKIGGHPFPVTATAFWNPEMKNGVLQIDISLF